jgi:hypothetical protein
MTLYLLIAIWIASDVALAVLVGTVIKRLGKRYGDYNGA